MSVKDKKKLQELPAKERFGSLYMAYKANDPVMVMDDISHMIKKTNDPLDDI